MTSLDTAQIRLFAEAFDDGKLKPFVIVELRVCSSERTVSLCSVLLLRITVIRDYRVRSPKTRYHSLDKGLVQATIVREP